MGLDYYIRINCPIQQPRSDEEFIQRAKVGEYAAQVRAIDERESQLDPSQRRKRQLTFPFPVKTLTGARAQMQFDDLIETAERIHRKSWPVCNGCPVNHKEKIALGCWGAISYPISQEGERWLIDQFNPQHSDDPGMGPSYLLHHMQEANVDGSGLDRKRREVDPDSESPGFSLLLPPGPAEKIVFGQRVTSSMILEYLLGCQPHLMPITLFGLLEDFNAIRAEQVVKAELIMQMMMNVKETNDHLKDTVFTLPPPQTDDRSVQQFYRFFKACHVALVNEGEMRIDG